MDNPIRPEVAALALALAKIEYEMMRPLGRRSESLRLAGRRVAAWKGVVKRAGVPIAVQMVQRDLFSE